MRDKANPAQRQREYAQHRRYVEAHREAVCAYQKEYRRSHLEHIRGQQAAYRAAHREDERAWWRERLYGLSPQAFADLLSAQGGACAICGSKDFGKRGPHVDHDHATGEVRGILCHWCNIAVGCLRDDPKRALAAADYLEHN
jgi:hypothetical protein